MIKGRACASSVVPWVSAGGVGALVAGQVEPSWTSHLEELSL